MNLSTFRSLETMVLADPKSMEMVEWSLGLRPCVSADNMLKEAVWVILGSGISHKAAKRMWDILWSDGRCAHPHKAAALKKWAANYQTYWAEYRAKATDAARIAYLRTLPYMGGRALPYQLAKNLGLTGYCKPDVHLMRLAEAHGYPGDPQAMCEALAAETGRTVAYIDTILWFAAMKGWAYRERGAA